MDPPITNQPIGGFGMLKENSGDLEGLERLAQLKELKIKQRHPGCLERKIFYINSSIHSFNLTYVFHLHIC